MGWVISHVWHLAGQDIEKTVGDICQKVHTELAHPPLLFCLSSFDKSPQGWLQDLLTRCRSRNKVISILKGVRMFQLIQ